MTIMTIDLGMKTGWAIQQESGLVTSGTISFKQSRFEGGGMPFLKFHDWLEKTHKLLPVSRIAFEEVRRHIGTSAAHAYGGFLSQLTSWCEKEKIPYEGIPVGTIKKSMTGRGNANKEAMIAAVQKLGYQPSDDNESDALAILHHILLRNGDGLPLKNG
ncbi:crossover junction endodeoxyribonuclease RuvC [Magnetococcales bacterium HHB-1]